MPVRFIWCVSLTIWNEISWAAYFRGRISLRGVVSEKDINWVVESDIIILFCSKGDRFAVVRVCVNYVAVRGGLFKLRYSTNEEGLLCSSNCLGHRPFHTSTTHR